MLAQKIPPICLTIADFLDFHDGRDEVSRFLLLVFRTTNGSESGLEGKIGANSIMWRRSPLKGAKFSRTLEVANCCVRNLEAIWKLTSVESITHAWEFNVDWLEEIV